MAEKFWLLVALIITKKREFLWFDSNYHLPKRIRSRAIYEPVAFPVLYTRDLVQIIASFSKATQGPSCFE